MTKELAIQILRGAVLGTDELTHEAVFMAIKALKEQERVNAEPVRHGRWIERTKVYPDLLNESTYNYTCSECGYWDQHGANVKVPYCWHCGAKMDEVKNGLERK